ncbi:MAG: elongation factor P [Anaerolineae bacterium]|jgi:elongation factor P
MIDVNELRKGVTFTMDGELYRVLEYEHHKPGRGKAYIRTKLRNINTGSSTKHTFISGDKVEDVYVERRGVQYLYTDGDLYHFMDTETYEQVAAAGSILGEGAAFLKPNTELIVQVYQGQVIDVDLPTKVDLEVVESEVAVAGDRATSVMKSVTTETGLEVSVPLFVEVGDVIRVDTRNGEYLTRV